MEAAGSDRAQADDKQDPPGDGQGDIIQFSLGCVCTMFKTSFLAVLFTLLPGIMPDKANIIPKDRARKSIVTELFYTE